MVALIALLLILALFGGLGFAAHILWIVLIVALVLWLIGFLIGGVESGVGRRRWYRRLPATSESASRLAWRSIATMLWRATV